MPRKMLSAGIAIALLLTMLVSLAACGGGSGGGGQPPPSQAKVIGTIQLNNDPHDPEVAVVSGNAILDKVILFGKKDTAGNIVQIQTMQYFPPDKTIPINIELDDSGKPVRIAIPEKGVLAFQYEGNVISMAFRDTKGNFYSENILAEGLKLPGVSRTTASLYAAHVPPRASASIITVESVYGTLNTYIMDASSGLVFGNIDPDMIDIVATNQARPGPVPWTREAKGRYRFTVAHRTADLLVLAGQCADNLAYRGIALTVIGSVAGVLTAGGTLAAQALGVWTLSGLLAGGGSFKVGVESFKCEELVRKGLIDRGIGKQRIDIKASIRNDSANTFVEYQLFDLNDPVGKSRSFVSTLLLPISPGIESVTAIPAQPKVGESYEVTINAVLPQGGYITWEWIRVKESLSKTGKWTNASDKPFVTALIGPFLGADSELSDEVLLKAYYTQGGSQIQCGEAIVTVNIRGKKSTRICPEGVWLVKYTEKCDPNFFTVGFWMLSPGGKWEPTGADGSVEADATSRWILNGDKISLPGKPTAGCNQRYHEGVVTDISGGCAKMEGKTYIKCQSPFPFVLENCWVATLDATQR